MTSETEQADYKRGLSDRKAGKAIAPRPESDAYYKGMFGEPLNEGRRTMKRVWGVAIAVALPISFLSYWIRRERAA
jgi:hypothetical protein